MAIASPISKSNWLVVIYSGHQMLSHVLRQVMLSHVLSHVTHNTRMHCHKRDWLMVVALFAPPLEAWIRWVAPFYALTITFRKSSCAHLDFSICIWL